MLYQIYATMIKDLKVILSDRGALAVLFLMPIMFILVMTSALGGQFNSEGEDNPFKVLIVNKDAGDLAAQTIAQMRAVDGLTPVEKMDGVTLNRERADELVANGDYLAAVVFPGDFSTRITQAAVDPSAEQAVVSFVADPATDQQLISPLQGALVGFIERTAANAQAPQQIETAFKFIAAQSPPEQAPLVEQIGQVFVQQMATGGGFSGAGNSGVSFEQVAPNGLEAEDFPTSAEQNVPAYTIFGVFFIVQALASSILREKQEGTFRRLLVAPMNSSALLLGKLLPYFMVSLIQVALMFVVGVLVFNISLGHAPLALLLVTLATAAAATGLGLLVAAIGKSPEQVDSMSSLLAVTMGALGGMFIPTFIMPEFMQTISQAIPHSWALAGYQDVIVRGLGTNAVLPEVAVLMGFAVAFFGLALWRFRFD